MRLRTAVLVLGGLALLATVRSLGNGFAFDDVPIIVENAQIHTLQPPWVYAQQSYWPPRNLGDAYRPWTVWWLAIQYAVAGPTPWAFHLVNVLLTVALVLAVFSAARLWVTREAALAGAAVFAVHPVHVEATANVVGQGELWMALFTTLAVVIYGRARRQGGPGAGTRMILALTYVLAAASKEQGIVLPAALLVVDLCPPAGTHPVTRRALLPTYALLAVAGGAFLAGRFLVLGDLGGGPPAAGIAGLDLAGRLGAMLPLVPEWLRLLAWPSSLLAQYSPPAHGGASSTAGALAGAAALVALGSIAVASRRRRPALAAGILWTGAAILPVSNVPFPTGVLIAERTLLLPSVGVALVVAGLVGVSWQPEGSAHHRGVTLPLLATAAAVALAVGLGAARSWSRQAVWRDNETLFRQTIVDGPRSYRAWFVYGRDLFHRGRHDAAKTMYARAADLWPHDRRVFEDWGFILRAEGRCDLAVPVLRRGVAAEPRETLARSRLYECLMTLGRFAEAQEVAEDGVARGNTEFESSVTRARVRAQATDSTPSR